MYFITTATKKIANLNKRIIKTPKVYFTDTGLAARLIGIEKSEQIATHPLKGALFENMTAVELLKCRVNAGKNADIMYYREKDGFEVDFIIEDGENLTIIEAKAGMTVAREMLKNLKKMNEKMTGHNVSQYLVYGGDEDYFRESVKVLGWERIGTIATNTG